MAVNNRSEEVSKMAGNENTQQARESPKKGSNEKDVIEPGNDESDGDGSIDIENAIYADSRQKAYEAAEFFSKLDPLDCHDIPTIKAWAKCFKDMFTVYPKMDVLYNRIYPDDRKVPRSKYDFIPFQREHYPSWLSNFNNTLYLKIFYLGLIPEKDDELNEKRSMYAIYKIVKTKLRKVLTQDMKLILDTEEEENTTFIEDDEDLRHNFLNLYKTDHVDSNLYRYHFTSPYQNQVRLLYPRLSDKKKKLMSEILVKHYLEHNGSEYATAEDIIEDFLNHPKYRAALPSRKEGRSPGSSRESSPEPEFRSETSKSKGISVEKETSLSRDIKSLSINDSFAIPDSSN